MKAPNSLLLMCQKLVKPLFSLLSKFRVLHQILIIISAMTFFLILEGLMALNGYNQMGAFSRQFFNSNMQNFQTFNTIKLELYAMQKQYLKNLANISQAPLSKNNPIDGLNFQADPTIQTQYQYLLEQLRAIRSQPITLENYQKFDHIMESLLNILRQVDDANSVIAANSMGKASNFYITSRNTSILLLVISILISLSIGLPIANMVSKPLNEMVQVVDTLATGDFTKKLNTKGSREVNQLVNSLNHAIVSLRALITNIKEQSRVLAQSGKELNDSSLESGRASGEVAHAIESMANAASVEANQISQTVVNVTELGHLVQTVSHESLKIAESSKQVASSAQEGQKISTKVASQIEGLYNTTKEVSHVIDQLSQSSKKIKGISLLIRGIAEQTTLLALNAAIEAARAGEHGKGFSVVAKETGKLAQQSKQASLEIGDLIVEMLNRSTHAVNIIQKGVTEVEAGKAFTAEAALTFGNIFKELEASLTQIKAVANTAQEMAVHNERVITAITSVAQISQEGLATTEEISATVEEQNAGAEEVAALASNLLGIAETMKTSVATFKI
jgi:methyl-accepting chemotaxis protein